MNSRISLISLVGVLLTCSGLTLGQQLNPNRLQLCPEDKSAEYHNCWGSAKIGNDNNYVGEFRHDTMHGYGALTSSLGDKYVGEFKDGRYHGQGTYNFWNGSKYVGGYLDGKKNGQGVFTSALGEKYVGEYKEGERHGEGTWTSAFGDKYVGEYQNGKKHGQGAFTSAFGFGYEGEWFDGLPHGKGRETFADRRKPKEGIFENGRFIRSEKVNLSNLKKYVAKSIDRNGINREREKIGESRRLQDEKRWREQQNKNQRVSLVVNTSEPTSDGIINIYIQTNADTASLKINGEEQGGKVDGNYSIKRVARVGQDTQFTITAVDIHNNSDSKTITVNRQAAPVADDSTLLKPETIKRASARDAVAIIIGIQDYKRAPKADFANNDAKEFHEYAVRALGVKPEKIKMLIDDEADEVNIVKAFENWLPIQVNKDKTDIYVFFSGHGLPAPDGKSLYFLPHGVDKELLSRTAVSQNDIVAALSAAKPKSVTMFIDACYSGQTRGGDILVANAKPVSLKSDTNAYPPNFTVITASANDQISSSSPELKHGIFSFYLMKGMEGEADVNKDGKITVGEMQDYLSDKVARQAMTLNRKQTTQLAGDADRVLVVR